MDFHKAIIEFLGIQHVDVEDISTCTKNMCVKITVRQRRGECFCSHCGLQFDGAKEWVRRKVQAPPLGIFHQVELDFLQLRGVCEDCQRTKMARAVWIHPEFKSMTCGFAETAGRLMEDATCEATARLLRTDSMTMWRVDQWRMAHMEKRLVLPENINVKSLAADEVHFMTVKHKKRVGLCPLQLFTGFSQERRVALHVSEKPTETATGQRFPAKLTENQLTKNQPSEKCL